MAQTNTYNARIQQKHDVEANWLKATTFIPKAGELIVYDIDESHITPRFKIGDGQTLVNNLPFSLSNDFTNEEKDKLANIPTAVDEADVILFEEFTSEQIQQLWDSVIV